MVRVPAVVRFIPLGRTAFVHALGMLIGLAVMTTSGCSPNLPTSPHAVVKRSQMLMGTLVFVTAVAPDQQVAERRRMRRWPRSGAWRSS